MPDKQRIYEAQERYVSRNKEKEMTRVNIWVPKGRAAKELKAIGKEMRDNTWFEDD